MRLAGAAAATLAVAAGAAASFPAQSAAQRAAKPHRALHPSAARLSSRPVRASGRWRRFVLDRRARFAYPRGVEVLGNLAQVDRPRGLMRRGGRATTIVSAVPGDVAIVLDFGIDTGGRVEAGIRAGSGGPLELSYSESRAYLQPGGDTRGIGSAGRNDAPNGRFDLIAGPGRFRSPGIRGGERYALLTLPGPGTYTIDYVRIRKSYLRAGPRDYAGHFLSSSRLLNRIWYAGAHTLNLDTARDPRYPHRGLRVVDGAKRDRLVWLGDLAIESLVGHYTVRAMPKLLGRTIHMFACQQLRGGYIPMASDVHIRCPRRPGPADGPPPATRSSRAGLTGRDRLPAFTAWWVVAVCDRYSLTGDRRGTRLLLPAMRRAMRYFAGHAPDGLFVAPPQALSWRAFDPAAGVDTYTNGVWAQALAKLAAVEHRIGSRKRARRDRRRARSVRRAMRASLFDPAAGLFRISATGAEHPQDANVEAVLAGAVRPVGARRVLATLRQRLWTDLGPLTTASADDPAVEQFISPYASGLELLARLRLHEGRPARALLRRLWGHMASTDPYTTTWEALAPDGIPMALDHGRVYPGNTSLAHGWSAMPTYALSAYVLGMRTRAPGWRRWLVEPQTIGLRFAQGQVGTPRGVLASRWSRGRHSRRFRLTVRGPRGTKGAVAVPLLGSPRTIARDGRVVWRRGRPRHGARAHRRGAYVIFGQRRGRHTYAWAAPRRRGTKTGK